jgi:hypothetical protein
MSGLYSILLGLFIIWIIFAVIIFFVRLLTSSSMHNMFAYIIIVVLLFIIYWIFGYTILGFYYQYVYLVNFKKNMEIWDNIWYSIAFILLAVIIALIVKSIKEKFPRVNLIFASIGLILILFIYTIIYYMIMFYSKIGQILLITFIIVAAMTAFILLLTWFRIKVFLPLYAIYGVACMIFIIALILYILSIAGVVYDYCSQ